MNTSAILFDLYGTLIDIETDEARPEVWDTLARFLGDQGLLVASNKLRTAFFERQQASLAASPQPYPELDVPYLFAALLAELGYHATGELALQVTRLFRSLSMVRFELFPDTLAGLQFLRKCFRLGLVSDAQRAYLIPELDMVGIRRLFDAIVISSDFGYRKPDPRLFEVALQQMEVPASLAIYVGDNMARDICGAHNAGLRAVLLRDTVEGRTEDPQCQPEMRCRALRDLCMHLREEEEMAH